MWKILLLVIILALTFWYQPDSRPSLLHNVHALLLNKASICPVGRVSVSRLAPSIFRAG